MSDTNDALERARFRARDLALALERATGVEAGTRIDHISLSDIGEVRATTIRLARNLTLAVALALGFDRSVDLNAPLDPGIDLHIAQARAEAIAIALAFIHDLKALSTNPSSPSENPQ
jgi:hypothetical protein